MNSYCTDDWPAMPPILLDEIYLADALEFAKMLPSGYLNAIITSPPYWGLRD